MNKAKRNNLLILAILMALVPALSFAQTAPANTNSSPTTIGVPQGFNGIFSCNQNGAYAMSVGALGATGGVYVPVADASVELNTGTLVYKECVLRGVVDAQRMAATAGFAQQGTNAVLTGNNGAALFMQQQSQKNLQVGIAALQAFLQNGLSSLDPNIQTVIKNGIAQGNAVALNNSS